MTKHFQKLNRLERFSASSMEDGLIIGFLRGLEK